MISEIKLKNNNDSTSSQKKEKWFLLLKPEKLPSNSYILDTLTSFPEPSTFTQQKNY